MLEDWRNSDICPVPIKTESQQQLTSLHRLRSTWMAARTMRINSARGLLREFGFVFPAGAAALPDHVRALIENADAPLPTLLRDLLHELALEIGELEARIKTVEKHLEALSRQTPVIERLRTISGSWPTHRHGAGRLCRRCRTFSIRSSLRLLSRSDTEGTLQRRTPEFRAD